MDSVVFTCPADKKLFQLKTDDIFVENTSTEKPTVEHRFAALWDTGASATGITRRVSQMLKLQSIRTEDNRTVGPTEKVNVYLANVFIGDRYCASNLEVHNISEGSGFDCIGINMSNKKSGLKCKQVV